MGNCCTTDIPSLKQSDTDIQLPKRPPSTKDFKSKSTLSTTPSHPPPDPSKSPSKPHTKDPTTITKSMTAPLSEVEDFEGWKRQDLIGFDPDTPLHIFEGRTTVNSSEEFYKQRFVSKTVYSKREGTAKLDLQETYGLSRISEVELEASEERLRDFGEEKLDVDVGVKDVWRKIVGKAVIRRLTDREAISKKRLFHSKTAQSNDRDSIKSLETPKTIPGTPLQQISQFCSSAYKRLSHYKYNGLSLNFNLNFQNQQITFQTANPGQEQV